ncbi:MAG TPA: (2Fe-2S)-binding protein [Candidatus Eremiobacteraceae bacterium]|nr:(2Fe-2S)-binding protein [Candidatus Eremiobacteraceae bacterium]
MSIAPAKVLACLHINGADVECAFNPNKTLLEVLREDVDLTGTKHGCEMGHCGACTVIVDGEAILSCLALAIETVGHDIRTVEGLASGGELHPVQLAFAQAGGAQCGYCTPGFIMSAVALLERDSRASREQIMEGLSGNLCRCTGYTKIIEAVEAAATAMRSDAGVD